MIANIPMVLEIIGAIGQNIRTVNSCQRLIRKMGTKVSPYGSWASPISSKLVSESSVTFQGVHVDPCIENKDTVYWSELRYDEGGRYVICSHKVGTEGYQSWTPEGFNARTRVHEYGGGAAFVFNGTLYFSNFADQNMYKQTAPGEKPVPVTKEGKGWRYADGSLNAKTGRIYCVREDHSSGVKGQKKEAVNTVVTINPDTGDQVVLASGCDFYSSPRVSPDGKKIAWIQWNHPNMPWDTTELWIADLNETGDGLVSGSAKQVSGGDNTSVIQPSWTCDNELLYISDVTDWWNLYHVTGSGEHVNLLPRSQECGGPQWVFGLYPYMVDPRGNGDIVTVTGSEMGVYNLKTKNYRTVKMDFINLSYVNMTGNGLVYCVAGSPTQFHCVIQVDTQSDKVTVLRESKSLSVDKAYFSIPKEITWTTSGGEKAYGYFYPPVNKDFTAPEGTLPPLLVKNHGGPTSQASSTLSLKTQYFTSRGMAVLDVNYRGSTGYGKQYRHRLRGQWGILDLDDSCTGAEFLAQSGKADRNKLCIDGGSAGGYTTLAAVTFRDTFKAGASHFGIGDLEALAQETHKFESRYLDTVIGPYVTEEDKKRYKERSPINYIEKLNCALALFQGDEDEIVPPNQAEMMYKAVKAKGLPTMYVLFKGEQHGFRKAENIQTALDGEFYFFSKVFGYDPADKHINLPIDNLK
ncbi:uncharacterized peptidase YuxL-like isoform X2 [Mya arenaria]|uniref:uncharacterized peptidase YuxL-like isoform X2 n=1 Tax=Mya arenaria TaxID=6604 RepID=UPI0022E5CC60|nr:uncharacterized peptidase YuxL-like isoform X2 [Mya arenaria]XP_052768630.1 uncharacterized peptidase YuxL-like isoform X2 [Mya arenaria]